MRCSNLQRHLVGQPPDCDHQPQARCCIYMYMAYILDNTLRDFNVIIAQEQDPRDLKLRGWPRCEQALALYHVHEALPVLSITAPG